MTKCAKALVYKPKTIHDHVGLLNHVSVTEPYIMAETKPDPQWKAVIQDELITLESNSTLYLVPYTPDMPLVATYGSIVKYKPDGTINKFKSSISR